MDPNRRLLQVVNDANPSLRSSAVPGTDLQYGGYNPQQTSVAPLQASTYTPQQQAPTPIQSADTSAANQLPNQNLYSGSTVFAPSGTTSNDSPLDNSTDYSSFGNFLKTNPYTSPLVAVGTSLANVGYKALATPVEAERAALAGITGNTSAEAAAQGRLSSDTKPLVGFARAIPRQVVQLGESINPYGGDVYKRSYQPTGGIQKAILGSTPIDTMQKEYKANSAQHGNVYAGNVAVLTSIFDALAIKGGVEKASDAINSTSKAIELSKGTNEALTRLQNMNSPEEVHAALSSGYGDTPAVRQAAVDIANSNSKIAILRIWNNLAKNPGEPLLEGEGAAAAQQALPAGAPTQPTNFTPEEAEVAKAAGVETPETSVTTPEATPSGVAPIPEAPTSTSSPAPIPESVVPKAPTPFLSDADKAQLIKEGFSPESIAKLEESTSTPAETPKTTPEQRIAEVAKENTAAPVPTQTQNLNNKAAEANQQTIAPTSPPTEGSTGLSKAEVAAMRKANYDEKIIQQIHESAGGTGKAGEKPPKVAAPETTAETTPKETPAPSAPSPNQPKTQPVQSDIPNLNKAEGKLQSARILEARLKGKTLAQTGPELRADIHAHEVTHHVDLQQVLDHIKPYTDLSKADRTEARAVVQGATTDNPAVQAAAQSVQEALKAVLGKGRNAGLEIGDRGPNYIPQELPKITNRNLNSLAKKMVDSGKATDINDAINKLTSVKMDNSLSQNKFSHYQQRTADIPGEATDQALMDYFKKATETNSLAKTFGAKGEVFDSHVANAVSRGEDAGALKDIISSYLHPAVSDSGIGSKTISGFQKVLRPIQLKAAVISHLPQSFAQTGSDVGFTNWLKSAKNTIFDPETQQFLHEAGLNATSTGHQSSIADKATAPGLNPIINKYREFAGAAGRSVAQGLAANGDEAGLRNMLVSGPLEKGADGAINLTKQQEFQAAHYQADKDIGSHSQIQNTSWAGTNKGKILGQYLQQYVFKQSERITNMFNEAKSGNVSPLLRYLAIALPVSGAVVAAGKNELKKPGSNPIGDKGFKSFALDALSSSGGLSLGYGAADKAYNAIRYTHNNPSSIAGAAASAVGALPGFAVQTGQNIDKAARGNPTALERQGLKMVPVAGSSLADKYAPNKPFLTPDQVLAQTPTTPAELKAQNSAKYENFVKGLSKDDMQYFWSGGAYKKGQFLKDGDIEQAHNAGILNDAQYEQAINLHQQAYNTGKNLAPPLPKGIDPTAAQYFNGQDQLSKLQKTEYAKAPPDAIQTQIATLLNKQKPAGIPDLIPNPELASSYSKFMKDIATNQNGAVDDRWTPIEMRDKVKAFWGQAAKDGASEQTKSVYNDGGTKSDYYVKSGLATKDDVAKAVQLDNWLMQADLTDSPKFNNKWRAANGYASANSFLGGSAGGSGSSGGSGGHSGTYATVQGEAGPVKGFLGSNGIFNNMPQGLTSLLTNNTAKIPTFNIATPNVSTVASKTPKLKNFAASDVRGTVRPERAVPIRYTRAKFGR